MRIAIISREHPPFGGGIGSWSSKAARGLALLGHEVHLFTESHDTLPAEDVASGAHIHRFQAATLRPRSLAWAWAAAHAVRERGPFDVVQACEWDAEALVYSLRPTAPLVTRLATPHVLVQSSNQATWPQRLRTSFTARMEATQARRSRHLISPTLALAREVAQRWRLDVNEIDVIPTGIDPPQLSAAPVPDFLVEAPYVLYFGRLEVRKGVDVLIDALPSVLEEHPDVNAVFIGQDMLFRGAPFADYAGEKCAEAWPRLHFLPRMPHAKLFNIVANATLVVIPSRWENLANTCLEAMVLGRPIVATSGSGFDEVLTHDVNGLLVPPGDAAALAAAMTGALADPQKLRRLGAAARKRAEDFTVERMASALSRVYERLVA